MLLFFKDSTKFSQPTHPVHRSPIFVHAHLGFNFSAFTRTERPGSCPTALDTPAHRVRARWRREVDWRGRAEAGPVPPPPTGPLWWEPQRGKGT